LLGWARIGSALCERTLYRRSRADSSSQRRTYAGSGTRLIRGSSGCLALDDPLRACVAAQFRELCDGDIICVTKNGIAHSAEGAVQTEILGPFVAEAYDQDSGFDVGQVLDVVKRAGLDVHHLSFLKGEAGEFGTAVKDVDEDVAREEIGHLVALTCPCIEVRRVR
jgi:hypothetical protein